jgi:hypothetical protein
MQDILQLIIANYQQQKVKVDAAVAENIATILARNIK